MEETKVKRSESKIKTLDRPQIEVDDEFDSVKNCPDCGSTNVFGMSRVVGYFSVIENWNKSKKEELKKRQRGKYWFEEEKKDE